MEVRESVLNMLKFEHTGKKIKVVMNHKEFEGILVKVDYFGRMTLKTIDGLVILFPKWTESIEVLE